MAVTLVASVGGCERRGLRNVGLCHDENEVKAAKVANLTVEQTREAVAEARTRAAVQELPVPGRLRFDPDDHISLEQWHKASPAARKLLLRPEPGARGTVPRFTAQTGTDIEWAMWSWNPVTGFEHDCPYSVQPKSAEAIPQVAEQVATLAGVAGATPARSRPRPGWRASTHSASSRRCTHGGCWLRASCRFRPRPRPMPLAQCVPRLDGRHVRTLGARRMGRGGIARGACRSPVELPRSSLQARQQYLASLAEERCRGPEGPPVMPNNVAHR